MVRAIDWCCVFFKSSYDAAGDRSIAVLVDRHADDTPEFILQSRAFMKGEEPPDMHTRVPMSLVTEAQVRFCPWCGRNLARWYKRDVDRLLRHGFKIEKGF